MPAIIPSQTNSFLCTPTHGDLWRIDLKKIAEEPSAAYIQALLGFQEK